MYFTSVTSMRHIRSTTNCVRKEKISLSLITNWNILIRLSKIKKVSLSFAASVEFQNVKTDGLHQPDGLHQSACDPD